MPQQLQYSSAQTPPLHRFSLQACQRCSEATYRNSGSILMQNRYRMMQSGVAVSLA